MDLRLFTVYYEVDYSRKEESDRRKKPTTKGIELEASRTRVN